MFNPFGMFARRRLRQEQTDKLLDVLQYEVKSRSFGLARGGGKAMQIAVPFDGENLNVLFQNKLQPADVKDGKLIPICSLVKRRGGKRITALSLSREAAEDFHKLLGRALKDARRKHRLRMLGESMMKYFSVFCDTQLILSAHRK